MLRFISVLILFFSVQSVAYTQVTPAQHNAYCNDLLDSQGRTFVKGTNFAALSWCSYSQKICVPVHQNTETHWAFCVSRYPDPNYCGENSTWSNVNFRCEAESCPAGQDLDANGQCTCTDGNPVYQVDGSKICKNDDDCTPDHPNYQGYILDANGNGKPYCDRSDDWCGAGQTLGMVNGNYQCMSNNPCENNGSGIWTEEQCKQPSENPDGTNTTGKTTEKKYDKNGNLIGEETTEQRQNPNTGAKTEKSTSKTFDPDTGAEVDSSTKEKTKEGETGDPADIEGKLGQISDGIGSLNETNADIKDFLTEGADPSLIEEPRSVSDVFNNFYSTVSTAPVFQAAQNMAAAFNQSASTCPTYAFNLPFLNMGGFTFDFHCQLWPQVSAIISIVMLLVYGFVGVRVILEA